MKKPQNNEEGRTVYIVCNSSKEVFPRNILRIYNTLESAQRYLGKYVTELNRSTYTGYLTIAEKKIGNDDTINILGVGEFENE
jgi:hypothetical protein